MLSSRSQKSTSLLFSARSFWQPSHPSESQLSYRLSDGALHSLLISHLLASARIKLIMATLRDTVLAEEEAIAAKRRFGLFSQPPPLAIGDDTLFHTKTAHKGEDGKPITEPRNIYSGVNMSGTGKKAYFNVPGSIYASDEYVDEFKRSLVYYNKLHCKGSLHEADFKPASGTKTLSSSAFKYIEEKPTPKKMPRRDENGRVATEPANMYTSPLSKVEGRYMKHPKHMDDPFERSDEISRQERLLWKSKLQESSFRTMSSGGKLFTKDKVQFGIDEKTKALMLRRQNHKPNLGKTVTHEARFKLARRGHGDPIGRFPEYIAAKCKTEQSAVQPIKVEKQRDDFRRGAASTLSRPTPSISLNPKNLHVVNILRRG